MREQKRVKWDHRECQNCGRPVYCNLQYPQSCSECKHERQGDGNWRWAMMSDIEEEINEE